MKKLILLLISLLLVSSIVSALSISKVIYLEEEGLFFVKTLNNGDKDLENVHITVFIPDANIFYRSNSFDIDSGSRKGRFIMTDNEIQQGEFLVRVTASNDKERTVRHIIIII